MPRKRKSLDRFADLTWDDLQEWAGSRIVSRGRSYQQQGRVSGLAATGDRGLIAWVRGSRQYAAKVELGKKGLLGSVCTCPFAIDCKHGVAVVLEYLEWVENRRQIPAANMDDERLGLLEDQESEETLDDEKPSSSKAFRREIDTFVKGKTRAQLIELILELAGQYGEIAQALADRRQAASGDTKSLVARLRREIRETGAEPGWQGHWRDQGDTPDYSGILKKLETLLDSGHADEVLALGKDLLTAGTRQVEQSQDEGETAMEMAACTPAIVKALDRSSLSQADRLTWAVDALLKDEFGLCEPMADYLMKRHRKQDWSPLADRLLQRLKTLRSPGGEADFHSRYARDRLSHWAIHALDRAGRRGETIPLCEIEATKTASYDRLVERLIANRRYEDAERWIHEGIRATKKEWPGIAASLRVRLREIRAAEKKWPAVAAFRAFEFVLSPSQEEYQACEKAACKVQSWPETRRCLLGHLENGVLPWDHMGWPLPATGLEASDLPKENRFPMLDELISIAIYEKEPDQVLRWYDRRPKQRFDVYGPDEDEVATAVMDHAPDRAVAIWKGLAESLINQAKPSAYHEAAGFMRKARQTMTRQKNEREWDLYLQDLREKHARKRRLLEVLDGLDRKPIVRRRSRR